LEPIFGNYWKLLSENHAALPHHIDYFCSTTYFFIFWLRRTKGSCFSQARIIAKCLHGKNR